jgi:hypothetical protein
MANHRPHDDESGAVLILALIFVLVVTLSIFGLITFGGVGILNSTNLQGQRSLEYAADGATSAAIEAVRYSDDSFHDYRPEDCLPDGAVLTLVTDPSTNPPLGESTTSQMSIDGDAMMVDCITGLPNSSVPQFTRVVTFYACLQTAAPCTANNSIVAATVDFEDVSSAGVDDCLSSTDSSTCGSGEVISSWVVQTSDN